MKIHFMVDIESLDTKPTTHIASIGCCKFNPSVINDFDREGFYQVVSTVPGKLNGTAAIETAVWWLKQSTSANVIFRSPGRELPVVLELLTRYLEKHAPDIRERVIWANGDKFDVAALEDAYRRCGMEVPWRYNAARCLRTLRESLVQIGLTPPDTEKEPAHNALTDAIVQSRWVQKAFATLRENLNVPF